MSDDSNSNNVNQFFDGLITELFDCEDSSPLDPRFHALFSWAKSRLAATTLGMKVRASNFAALNDLLKTFKPALQLARFDIPKIKLPGIMEERRDVIDYAMELLWRCKQWHETEVKALSAVPPPPDDVEFSNEGYPVEFGPRSWQYIPAIVEELERARSLVLRYEIAGVNSLPSIGRDKTESKRQRNRPTYRTQDELDALNSTKKPAIVDESMIRKGAKCYFRHEVIDWYQGHTAALKTRERALRKNNDQTKRES